MRQFTPEELEAERVRQAEANRRELAGQNAHEAHYLEHGECQDDGYVCTACCEHPETDHGICYECGDDRSEWMMAAAYDRAKDARYG